MVAFPTETEVQTNWKNAVAILEDTREYIDDILADGSGKWDTLAQSLAGNYIPTELSNFLASFRAQCSVLIDSSQALAVMEPILLDYAATLADSATGGYGSGFRSPEEIFAALYEWLDANSDTIAERAITYTAVTKDSGAAGNAVVNRLTKDRKAYNLEACHVEKKMIRCIADQNTGVQEWAESFEITGETASFDAVLRGERGSGDASRTVIRAKHAGSGAGGSLLNNSSFSDFTASVTSAEQFDQWTETIVGGATTDLTQDTTNYYRSHPNASTNGSAKMALNAAAESITLKQTLTNMRVSRFDPSTPYFLRAMWNRQIGSGVDGTVSLKLGGNSAVTATVASQTGWQELVIPFDATCWPEGFNEDGLDIEISWTTGAAGGGYVLFDDLILAPWDLVDGTYWLVTHNAGVPAPNLRDDFYYTVDTGGAAGTGKLQYWCWVSGLGYLPAGGVPTITDPA